MHGRTTPLVALLIVAVLAAIVPGASRAADGVRPPPIIIEESRPAYLSGTLTGGGAPATVMLELAAPLPEVSAGADTAAKQLAVVAQTQEDLARRLASLGVPILFQTRAAYSGIAVEATPQQLALLRSLPGVADVHVIPPKTRASTSVVNTIGASRFWSINRQQILGQGMRVGVIDSGIDYTHATFGGPGTPGAFDTNDPAIVEPGSFPTAKVVAGRDFVGDGYDPSGAAGSAAPVPDGDPLDCRAGAATDAAGHGTHVASIAAGYGVDPQGATFRGTYSASTSFDDFTVQPGVAPEASLVALKIFGCRGKTTTFLTAAIDYALDPNGDGDTADRLVDVLNISLGSPFGSSDDPDAVAVDRAVRAGVVVVVSAGDAGDVFYSVASPSTAALAISVGASVDASGATAPLPAGSVWTRSARGPQQGNGALKPDLVAPGVAISAAAAGGGNSAVAMTGTSTAAPQVAGAAALLLQLRPEWSPAQIKAAVINSAVQLQTPGGASYAPSRVGAGQLNIEPLAAFDTLAYPSATPGDGGLTFGAPAVSAPTQFQRELTIENTGGLARTVQLEAVTTVSENGVTLELPPGPFTVPPNSQLQIPVTLSVAPQLLDNTADAATEREQSNTVRYYMAEHGGYVQVTSTLGARVRFANAADTGDIAVTVGGAPLDSNVSRGAVSKYGLFTPGNAVVRVTPAFTPGAPALLEQQVTLLDGQDYTITLWGRPGSFQLALLQEGPATIPAGTGLVSFLNGDPYGDGSAVDFYVDMTLVAPGVPAGETRTLPIANGPHRFRVVRAGESSDRAVINRTFGVGLGDQFLFAAGKNPVFARHSHLPAGGPQNRQTARVPFQIFPRAASDASAATAELVVPEATTTFSLTLRNAGARNASLANAPNRAQVALVSAFSLDPAGVSPAAASIPEELRFADVQYVGVTTNLPATQTIDNSNTSVFFGIATHAPWNTPNEVEFRTYIDSNFDDVPDYVISTTSLGTSSSSLDNVGTPNDVFISRLFRLPAGGPPQFTLERADWNTLPAPTTTFATAGIDPSPFNTRVTFVAARATSLGLSAAQPRLRYFVETRARDAGGFTTPLDRVPATGYLEYSLLNDALAPVNIGEMPLTSRPLFSDTEGGQVSMAVNQAVLSDRGIQQLLLLHHHNAPPSQAEVVQVWSSSPLGLRANPTEVRSTLPYVSVWPIGDSPLAVP
jgi:subtilisin family serine protease